ncbi:PspC domain-containing protein [Corynebacterium marambiense]|nr:ATP-binding protein [Corynebacterium marambiense]
MLPDETGAIIETMATPPAPAQAPPRPYPRFTRVRQGRVIGGVATGLSRHLGVDVRIVRLLLALSCLLSGAGVLCYALIWVLFSQTDGEPVPGSPETSRTDHLLVVLAIIGALVAFALVTGSTAVRWWPLLIIGLGAVIVWRTYDRGMDFSELRGGVPTLLAGGTLVLTGIILVLVNWENRQAFGTTLMAVLLTLAGVAVLGVPLWLKMWEELTRERAERLAAAERAEIASRLHDSVLQTLALIQKRAGEDTEIAGLARSQERELRQWLFGQQENAAAGAAATVFAALELACGEVEDTYSVRIAPVTVGADSPLTETTRAVILAAREAMVNAARHSGVRDIDVYAEHLAGELSVYVRDRGRGFDPDDVPDGHHGLAGSIRGRVTRVGGTVVVKSAPGAGTEVILRVPVSDG